MKTVVFYWITIIIIPLQAYNKIIFIYVWQGKQDKKESRSLLKGNYYVNGVLIRECTVNITCLVSIEQTIIKERGSWKTHIRHYAHGLEF